MKQKRDKLKQMRIDPKPFAQFQLVYHSNRDRALIKYKHEIATAAVDCPVKVEGCVLTKIDLCNPQHDPWFLVRCANSFRVVFWLVTNGDKWYHYDSEKQRLVDTIRVRNSVNLQNLNQIDQEILQLAISYYLQDGGIHANQASNQDSRQATSNRSRHVVRI